MSNFAANDEEAKKRFAQHEFFDPFPEIAPALLNSADIFDYVERTGLIYPFYPNNLKPTSYGIRLKGEFIYWTTREDRISGRLENLTDKDEDGDTVFILKRNSIAFVQLEPTFRFPAYVAARFNLKIKHVYQGLLLGTGPLVDPGYEGNIYIPLHNLTNNDYKIKIDKPLIWMEFTKLSTNKLWESTYEAKGNRNGQYHAFDKSKLNAKRTLAEYINDAAPNSPVLSTIPGIVQENIRNQKSFEERIQRSETAVRESTTLANQVTGQFNRAIIIAVVAICTTLFGICITIIFSVYQTISVHNKAVDYLKEYDKTFQAEHLKSIESEQKMIDFQKQIESQSKIILLQADSIRKLRKK